MAKFRKKSTGQEVQGGHSTGASGSSQEKHQRGDQRRIQDQQGTKAKQKSGMFNKNTRSGREAAAANKAAQEAQKKKGRGR
ncbi:hypothetical protein Kfla_6018 [Kribbella flavida DSM 17836]|uniref:Uncharacterized protein n=1 Tax=Kribbella flavida (strain DSM 17836 / JCM 10339 / NBRC 14399) TaxID=479435 RepID=D2PSW9_KRIFD|nr:hypothetical protein [Kribbella flavida]ADB35021.1 hypothetical protein Kfla_6018 [Kribbella flavida DSM 17836]